VLKAGPVPDAAVPVAAALPDATVDVVGGSELTTFGAWEENTFAVLQYVCAFELAPAKRGSLGQPEAL